jgi:PAS domain S-box-containing protein
VGARTQARSLEQEPEYRAIFEASSDGLVVNDLDTGIVLEANPAFCRMHGYDHMAGLHPSAFIHAGSQHLFEAFMRAVQAGEEFRCQAQDVRQDGTVFDVEVLGRGFSYQGKPATLGVVRDVTERVRAYEVLEQRVAERTREIERRQEVAEGMRELLAVVNSKRPLDQILDDVVRQAGRLLGSDAEALYLLDERDPSSLRLQASRNLPPGAAPPTVASGTPTMGLAAERRRLVVAPDLPRLLSEPFAATVDEQVHDRGAYLELVRRGPASADEPLRQRGNRVMAELFRSEVAVPLLARGTCYGSLALAYRARHMPSDDELALIAAFASQAGLAIESARLQEQADRRLRELEGLYQADGEMHRSLRLDDVLQALVDVAATMLRGDKTSVLVWDAQHTRLAVRAAHGFAPETVAQMSFGPGEGVSARVAASGEPIAVYEVRTDPRIPPRIQAINQAAAIRSLISVPIMLNEQVFGVFNVNCTEPRTFGRDDQRVLAALAQRAALAIQNAQLHEQSEQRRHELEALYQAEQALHRSLRLQDVLAALVDTAADLLHAEGAGLWGPDPAREGGIGPLATRGLSAEYLQQTVLMNQDPSVYKLWWDQESFAVEDISRDPRIPSPQRAALEREGYNALLTTQVRVGDELFGSFTVGHRTSYTFSEAEQRLLSVLAQRAGLAIENARLHEESERRLAELEALYRADEQIYGSLRVQEVLDALVDVAAGILRPDKVAVGIWDERTDRIVVGAARGFDTETVAAWVPPEEAGPLLAHLEGGVVVMADVQADPRLPASIRLANEREGVRSTMTAPIKAGTAMIGAFGLSYCQPRTFGVEEQRLLQALAQRAALAIQNARLYEQAQQAATLEERQRLARELHDAVTQTLFSTALIAEVLPELWDLDPDEGRQRLAELRRLTRGALAEMRTLLVELRPGALTELPLSDLLRQLAEATAGRTRLQVVARVEGQARSLPPTVQVALYRIAQEALNNVVKHAQARRAAVTLGYEADGGVRLLLDDDGHGFDPSAIPAGHLGVEIMRERAAAIGAEYRVDRQPGEGTAIEVHWQNATVSGT